MTPPRGSATVARERTFLPIGAARPRDGAKMSLRVAAELRRRIVRGQVGPGDTLPTEAELVRALDVSRDTLREALRMLESESLIHIRRGRYGGAVVRRPDLRAISRYGALLLQTQSATLEDLHEARLIFEAPAAKLLSDRLSPAILSRLTAIYESQARQTAQPLALVKVMRDFDQAVIDFAGNKVISLFSGLFRDIFAGELYVFLTTRPSEVSSRLLAKQAIFIGSLREERRSEIVGSWLDYLAEVRNVLAQGINEAGRIDVTPFWRAEVSSERSDIRTDKMASIIAVEVRARIAEGRLSSGDKLPPIPELAESFGVSRPILREALRILERESLVDVRTGPRGGVRILGPSTQMAAQLAAILLETQQTTIGDIWEARILTEPAVVGLAAKRLDAATLSRLESTSQALGSAVSDTPRFVRLWTEGEVTILGATVNRAITVAERIASWIHAACQNEITVDALNLPWVERSNRRAKLRFDDVVAAASRSDGEAAETAWSDYVTYTTPFFQALSDRLILDMLD